MVDCLPQRHFFYIYNFDNLRLDKKGGQNSHVSYHIQFLPNLPPLHILNREYSNHLSSFLFQIFPKNHSIRHFPLACPRYSFLYFQKNLALRYRQIFPNQHRTPKNQVREFPPPTGQNPTLTVPQSYCA